MTPLELAKLIHESFQEVEWQVNGFKRIVPWENLDGLSKCLHVEAARRLMEKTPLGLLAECDRIGNL